MTAVDPLSSINYAESHDFASSTTRSFVLYLYLLLSLSFFFFLSFFLSIYLNFNCNVVVWNDKFRNIKAKLLSKIDVGYWCSFHLFFTLFYFIAFCFIERKKRITRNGNYTRKRAVLEKCLFYDGVFQLEKWPK